jgi:hypothetical protein
MVRGRNLEEKESTMQHTSSPRNAGTSDTPLAKKDKTLLAAIALAMAEIEYGEGHMLTECERNNPRGTAWVRVYDRLAAARDFLKARASCHAGKDDPMTNTKTTPATVSFTAAWAILETTANPLMRPEGGNVTPGKHLAEIIERETNVTGLIEATSEAMKERLQGVIAESVQIVR